MGYPENSHTICEAITSVLENDAVLLDLCNEIYGTTYFGIDDYLLDPGSQNRPAFVVTADVDEEFEDEDANGKQGMIRQQFFIAIYLTGGANKENREYMSRIRHIVRRIIHEKDTLNGYVWNADFVSFTTDEESDESNKNYFSLGQINTRRLSE